MVASVGFRGTLRKLPLFNLTIGPVLETGKVARFELRIMNKKKFQNSMNKLEFGMMSPKFDKLFLTNRSLLNLIFLGSIACI
jgi:hypothetical protein